MDTEATSSAAFDFSGSIPHHCEECLGPMFFEPYAIEVSKRINPSGVRIALEIASGTGRVTRHLRNVIPPPAKQIASDIRSDMLTVAKERLKTVDIQWNIIDAQELPFEDGGIDLVVCCFGYMFVSDRSKAFAEAYRVLRPGGMFLITTWDRLELNGASNVYRTLVRKYLEAPLPEFCNLAFSLNDESVIRSLLQDAGFSKIKVEKVKKSSVCKTAREAAA